MGAKAEFRDRPAVDVAVLDALVERAEEGMTVFELRAAVDADIDRIEAALSRLKDDGLITVDREDGRVRLYPHERVVPDPDAAAERDAAGLLDRLRRRLGL